MRYFIFIFVFMLCLSCVKGQEGVVNLIDKDATSLTKALYRNLKNIQGEGKVLFGHQDAILYGRSWVGDNDRSDVKDVTGSHPAVIGLDFEKVTSPDQQQFEKAKESLVMAVSDTYKRGGISTFAWHASNPANDGSFYWEKDPVKVIPDILPDGKLHNKYKDYLKAIAAVSSDFKTDEGDLIPVIFRPFHEFDGDWFWWGKGHCTKDEFISLWRFTIEYLRDSLNVHNFIYALSPDCKFFTENEFLDYYPGDNYVDMFGMDNYWDFRPDGANNPELAKMKLKIVSDIAARKNKLAAFTETGLEGIPQTNWFTQVLLPVIREVRVCYVLVWRNASDMKHHYYVPTVGHIAADDFKEFTKSDVILMENDLPDMYK